jgi:TolA-binding protein
MRPRSPFASALLAVLCSACAERSPLAGGPTSAEDLALIALVSAFQDDDCAEVEALAAGFTASTDLRLHTATTLYGRCRYRRGDDLGAVALLARVAYAEPPDRAVPTALYWLARARLHLGDAATAVSDLLRFGERFAHDALADDATYYLGKAHLDAGDPDLAGAAFAQVLAMPMASELRRAGATYQTGLALVERARGDPASPDLESAFIWFQRVRDDFATSIYADNAAYRQGRVRYDQGRLDDAERVLVQALAAYPDSSRRPSMAWYLGETRYRLQRFPEAIEAFATTLADPGSVYHDNALYYSGRSFYRMASPETPERFASASRFFERVLAEHPDSVYADDAAYFAARAAYQLEDLEAAERAFSALPSRFPTSPYVDNAWHYLVLVRLALGDCPGAALALQALEALSPPSSYSAATRGAFEASACGGLTP